MILNVVLLVIGAAFLFYGLKKKLKFWVAIGAVVACLALASIGVDLMTTGGDANAINNRLPFVINGVMK